MAPMDNFTVSGILLRGVMDYPIVFVPKKQTKNVLLFIIV
jgi:hypothetical protein